MDQNLPIGQGNLQQFLRILQHYKAGKRHTEQRILSSESWWKLRNTEEEQAAGATHAQGFTSRSGWLHNVIVSKHADGVDAYPEPRVLPREPGDRDQARMLSAVLPCVLEQNNFAQTYSDILWQKLKTGTGVYKVAWDRDKLSGLGDIEISRVNLLNLYWEPGITDIQNSRYLFHTELVHQEELEENYPEIRGKAIKNAFLSTKFLYDDTVDTSDKVTVIDVYYRKKVGRRRVLHYCKFAGDTLLYATENDFAPASDLLGRPKPPAAEAGLYDHGFYPYVFDTLYPIEGSPCGYGFVDICRNPQTEIDILKTAFVKNARVGAVPRYFSRVDGNVNQEQFLDLEQALVQVSGNVDEATLRPIAHQSLDGNYIALLDRTVDELRQTSGNTETSTGNFGAGVTAASAIAALQEASGKGSRDANATSYRAFSRVVELCIELMRQFYELPRQFRILGELGAEEFVIFTNSGLLPQAQMGPAGPVGYRLPVFDLRIEAQRKSPYSRASQNELALQFFRQGFFDPRKADEALMCLEMMDFDEKPALMQAIAAQQRAFLQANWVRTGGAANVGAGRDPTAANVGADTIRPQTAPANVGADTIRPQIGSMPAAQAVRAAQTRAAQTQAANSGAL